LSQSSRASNHPLVLGARPTAMVITANLQMGISTVAEAAALYSYFTAVARQQTRWVVNPVNVS